MTFRRLLDKLPRRLARAFREAVQDMKDNADIVRVANRIREGKIEEALDLLNLLPEFYQPLLEEIRAAFLAGGLATVQEFPKRIVARFDIRNPRAEEWLRNRSSNLITEINGGQRQMAREILEDSMMRGLNPRETAVRIVGKINPSTGKRTGGFIGLTSGQAQSVRIAERELRSGRRYEVSKFLKRKLRDRRYDIQIRKHLREGIPLPPELIEKVITSYQNRVLKLRGDTIGRTETLASTHAAQNEGLQQTFDSGKLSPENVSRVWDATPDGRTRKTHWAVNGQSRRMGETFLVGDSVMRYPGDELGKPEERINCRCWLRVEVDYLAGLT